MTRTLTRWMAPGVALAGLLAVGFTWAGQAQEPTTAQKVGEKIDGAVQDIKGGLNKAGEAIKDRFSKAKTSASNLGVEARVYSRLHWDKSLSDGMIELTGEEPGVFILTGQVASAEAKKRAVDLAETTVGVTRVVDQLSIRPAGTTSTTTTTTKTRTSRP